MLKEYQEKNGIIQPKQKQNFIAFGNERDQLGRIVGSKRRQKNNDGILQIFENIKKTTKEYFFDKELERRRNKFRVLKRGLMGKREYNYVGEVDQCLKLMEKQARNSEEREKNKENLFVNLREKINDKFDQIKSDLKRLKKSKSNNKPRVSKQFLQTTKILNISLSNSCKSSMLATLCQQELKCHEYVEMKKLDPWKKWYRKKEYEFFPGKKIVIKQLEKSIY